MPNQQTTMGGGPKNHGDGIASYNYILAHVMKELAKGMAKGSCRGGYSNSKPLSCREATSVSML